MHEKGWKPKFTVLILDFIEGGVLIKIKRQSALASKLLDELDLEA